MATSMEVDLANEAAAVCVPPPERTITITYRQNQIKKARVDVQSEVPTEAPVQDSSPCTTKDVQYTDDGEHTLKVSFSVANKWRVFAMLAEDIPDVDTFCIACTVTTGLLQSLISFTQHHVEDVFHEETFKKNIGEDDQSVWTEFDEQFVSGLSIEQRAQLLEVGDKEGLCIFYLFLSSWPIMWIIRICC